MVHQDRGAFKIRINVNPGKLSDNTELFLFDCSLKLQNKL